MASAFANSVPAPHTAWREHRLVVAGVRIAAFECGPASGPTIALVHGLGHWTDAAWGRLAPLLAQRYRIVAFDLPGFGESERPDASYDLPFFRLIVLGVLDVLAPHPIALVGHSLGGMICADVAAAIPDRIGALVLIDPAGFLRAPRVFVKLVALPLAEHLFQLPPSRKFVRRSLDQSVYDTAVNSSATHARAYELACDRLVRRAFGRVYSGAMQELLRLDELHAQFGTYTKPTLIMWGKDDRFVPIKALAEAQKAYPHATVRVFEQTAHCPMMERPAAVADAIEAFLR